MSVPGVMRGTADRRRGVRLWAMKNAVFLAVTASLLLAVSGHPGWPAAWTYLIYLAGYLTLLGILLYRLHPDLLAERSGVQEGSEHWDVPLASLSAVWLPLVLYLTAALDERFAWPPAIGWSVQAVGAVLLVSGSGLVLEAMVANPFFSAVVRVQADRGHVVVMSGPYRLVRHPGYLGTVLLYPGVALMLASAWALLPAVAVVVVTCVRTALEDRFLNAQLPGYRGYAQRVRYRMLPGLW
jgi:protein-S-isoprenylcysteine O-methyltransferase Ste14